MKAFYAICTILFMATSQSSHAQITPKDFRVCIDNIGCSDSVLKISKAELLKASRITPNFSWLTIKSLTIYVGEGNYTSEITTIIVKGDTINNEARKIFQRLASGGLVTIEVEGYNKRNERIPWGSLSLRIL